MDGKELLSEVANSVKVIKEWFQWLAGLTWLKPIFSGTGLGIALGVVQPLVAHLLDAMQGVKTEVTGVSHSFGTVDAPLLQNVNYFLPIDSFASCVVLYIGVYCAVQMARLWAKIFSVSGQVAEKVPFI